MANEANEVSTQIAYDGEALRAGSMDVRDLAPALLSVGDLLQHANRVLNGDKASLAVKVRSDFKRGSFELNFELIQAFAMAYMFSGIDALTTAKQIAEYVGFVSGHQVSLLGLLKWLRGKRPKDTTTLKDGNIEITIEGDNNRVVVNPTVYRLASDPQVRKAARDVVKPLYADGIDTFEVRQAGRVVESVRREDLPAFELPLGDERDLIDIDPERIAVVEVIKPSFQEQLSWMFSDGSGGRFGALMLDKNFLRRVQSGERTFAKGDVLRVRLRTRAYMTPDGLRAEHAVTDVLSELNQPRQPHMMPEPRFERPAPIPTPTSGRRGAKRKRRQPN